MNIAVLGAGMVGRAIAKDLAPLHSVTSFDINEMNLDVLSKSDLSIQTICTNLQNYSAYQKMLHDFNFVISAVPGFMGYETLKHLILLKKQIIDISFFPENALELHELAVKNNVRAIVDCGVAPGMSNLILGRLNEEMEIQSFECMVGGLPKIRRKPFEYKAPFSPVDVIEEYTRPARYVENGKIVTKPALSDAEYVEIQGVGTLESFNTDGLRSILYTMNHIPNMKEKTLRYPGHIDLIRSLFLSGFFSEEQIMVKGKEIRPLDVTSALLFKEWKLEEEEPELTVMTMTAKGFKNNKAIEIQYHLYDEYDVATKTTSMSRTTGYTCTAAMHVLTNDLWKSPGIYPPELIGKNQVCFDFILQYLADRNVRYKRIEI